MVNSSCLLMFACCLLKIHKADCQRVGPSRQGQHVHVHVIILLLTLMTLLAFREFVEAVTQCISYSVCVCVCCVCVCVW